MGQRANFILIEADRQAIYNRQVKTYFHLLLLLSLISCQNQTATEQPLTGADTTPAKASVEDTSTSLMPISRPVTMVIPKDTIIEYDIEGISAESSEAKVHYINGAVRDVEWHIYGETGQVFISYTFQQNGTIKALEKTYTYPGSLESVKSDKDIRLKKTFSYQLDSNGVLLSKVTDKDFVNIFPDLKKNVPLKLP